MQKLIYGLSRDNKNKIEYHIFESEDERNKKMEEFSKKYNSFCGKIIDSFGQKNILYLKYDNGLEKYITDSEIIMNFI